jgi:NADH-quinone oxidoreductase subunit J
MNFVNLLFYIFSATAIVSALMVVTLRNTVHCVLFLVLTFFAAAANWLLLESEFLALVLVLVYVGAVMTLFLFVVMMLNLRREAQRERLARFWPVGLLAIICVTALIVLAARHGNAIFPVSPAAQALDYSNVTALGNVLYTTYVWPFEIAAVLLLTAIVAAIALGHGRVKQAVTQRRQDPAAQIAVRRNDRVRLINMPTEKKG